MMSDSEAKSIVDWFIALCPAISPEQCRLLHKAIQPFPADSVRQACERAATHHRFPADAIVAITAELEQRHGPPPERTAVDLTRERVQRQRNEAAQSIRRRRADDRLIRETPRDILDRVANEVLAILPTDEAGFLKAKGFLARPAWRGLTAAALRRQEVTHAR